MKFYEILYKFYEKLQSHTIPIKVSKQVFTEMKRQDLTFHRRQKSQDI